MKCSQDCAENCSCADIISAARNLLRVLDDFANGLVTRRDEILAVDRLRSTLRSDVASADCGSKNADG